VGLPGLSRIVIVPEASPALSSGSLKASSPAAPWKEPPLESRDCRIRVAANHPEIVLVGCRARAPHRQQAHRSNLTVSQVFPPRFTGMPRLFELAVSLRLLQPSTDSSPVEDSTVAPACGGEGARDPYHTHGSVEHVLHRLWFPEPQSAARGRSLFPVAALRTRFSPDSLHNPTVSVVVTVLAEQYRLPHLRGGSCNPT